MEAQLKTRLWPVHRLDVEVSGLILFALTAAAHKAAGRWFETRTVGKSYEALTEERSDEARGDLAHDSRGNGGRKSEGRGDVAHGSRSNGGRKSEARGDVAHGSRGNEGRKSEGRGDVAHDSRGNESREGEGHGSSLRALLASGPGPWVWRSTLARGKRRAYLAEHGKPAETQALYLGPHDWGGQTVHHWQLNPVTGRPHQLRFDLARHGFPILGDLLYGASKDGLFGYGSFMAVAEAADAIALQCQRLNFAACAEAAAFGLPNELSLPSFLDPVPHPS